MLVAFAFKGGTNGIPAAACGAGAYADPLGGAVALAVVVDAILHTAGDAVDMLGDTLFVVSVIHGRFFLSVLCSDGGIFPERRRFYVLVRHCGSSFGSNHE